MSEAVACQTHPTVPAADRCAGCAEPFCGNCLVEMYGQKYCGSCKVMALKGQPMPEIGDHPCKEASTAFILSIIGIFLVILPLLGVILGASALAQAHKASQLFNANPQLTGREKMRAARIIGGVAVGLGLVMWISNMALSGKGGR
jgi:hypothetical protein